MNPELRELVRRRAGEACEYCHMPQSLTRLRFQIDHAVARQHGGETDAANLAWACLPCNKHKGPNLSGLDPETGLLEPIFNPRRDKWNEHFAWRGPILMGLTPTGRATIRVLAINDPGYVAARRSLIEEGRFSPTL